MTKIFLNISKFFLFLLVFLLPIFVLPFSGDFFIFPKITLFLAGSLLAFLFWLLAQVFSKKFLNKTNRFLYPLTLLFLTHLASLLVNWSKEEKFAGIWASLPFLVFPLFSFLLVNLIEKKKETNLIKSLLLANGLILSGLAITLFLLPTTRYPLNLKILGFPFIILNSNFSLTGNSLTSLFFLFSLLPIIFQNFSDYFSQEDKSKWLYLKVIFHSLLTLVIVTGLGVTSFQVFFLSKPILLPYSFGWAIGVETLKNPLNALFGLGPGEFQTAFTQFKPLSYNLSNLWSIRFSASSNELFQILTTLGLTGIAAFLFLLSKILKVTKKGPEFYSLAIVLFSFIFIPENFLTYFFLVVFLSLSALENNEETKNYTFSKELINGVGIATMIGIVIIFYLLGRFFAGEFYFQKSLIAASENKGVDTYNLQIKALSLNPYKAYFHQIYSQTNLALANSLASKKSSDSTNQALTDQEKQTITQLIQQAIREARNASLLAPQNVGIWENMGTIYRQIINFAQGADQWATASLSQAIKLDPNNPLLYLELGGLNFSSGKYDEAIGLFQTTVGLKPDLANGWYNLAAAYKEKKEYQKALDSLNQAVRFVAVDSSDFQKLQKEIEEVKAKLPKEEEKPAKGEETLKLPEPLPSPKPELTPIELPNPEEATSSP